MTLQGAAEPCVSREQMPALTTAPCLRWQGCVLVLVWFETKAQAGLKFSSH